jgi:ComF family protein
MKLEYILRLIFPPKCIFCGKVLNIDVDIEVCEGCYAKIPFMSGKLPQSYDEDYRVWYDDIICACEYSGIIKDAIQGIKFKDKPSNYRALSAILAHGVKKMTRDNEFDIIVAVPLHKKREKQRGYNQMALVARELSKLLGCKDMTASLIKIKHTETQSSLLKRERLQNIKDAFKVINEGAIRQKNILLIDDVFTTGATANECSRVLKKAGASSVITAVIASGRR